MARRIDVEQHEQHKAEIAAAVWRLAARSGLESVSLREVAAEAGVSMGRVQHYFATKDEMLLYSLRSALHRMDRRIERRLARQAGAGPEEVLRAAIAELFGDDRDTRQAIRVSVAYLGRAMDDSSIAELLYSDDAELRKHTAAAIRTAQAEGRAARAVDPDREAHLVWSLANGLAIETACGQTSVAEAHAIMTYHLDGLFERR